MSLRVDDDELERRRARLLNAGGYAPKDRQRPVSLALRAYAAMATSADRGAVRDVESVERALRERELRTAAV
jgi:dihydroxy-acid dehydratase